MSTNILKTIKLDNIKDKGNFIYLANCLKNDKNLQRYSEWLISLININPQPLIQHKQMGPFFVIANHQSERPYAEFFSLVFQTEGRIYLDSLLNITSNDQSYFDYTKMILLCYASEDQELKKKILLFVNELEKLIRHGFSEQIFHEFQSKAQELQDLLNTEPYVSRFSEEKKKKILRIASFILPIITVPLFMAAVIALPFFPVLNLGVFITTFVLISLLLMASVFTPVIGFEVFAPVIDTPVRAKNILETGQRYGLFFKKENEREHKELLVDFSSNPEMQLN
jgi:hypothetical protein